MKNFIVFVLFVLALVAGFTWYLTDVPGTKTVGALPALDSEEEDLKGELQQHVVGLARDIGARSNSDPSRIASAIGHVEDALRRTGLQITREPIQAAGKSGMNLIADLRGSSKPNEIVLVGAHLDSPRGSPGADCDASGVAVAIELAQRLSSASSERTLRFAFFSLSEAPFAGTDGQGAFQHAKKCAEKQEKIVAALMLEGLGSFSDQPGSQSAPFPFSFSFPDKGDFVAFVSDVYSRDLLRRSIAEFRVRARMPSEGCAVPGVYPGFSGTDAAAFSRGGFPAVLVTDTGSLRYSEYGKPSDTHDRLDYARMARVAAGLQSLVASLASGRAAAP
ncbi:MAG: M28 family peptidase [Planctomycetes bacterium]|nr:M28 family peptidase [Planctomycetota bacterium]